MSRLLLLTNHYPFARGEEYLDAELPHLAAAFDEVVVIATMAAPGATATRAVPEGVRVLNAGAGGPLARRPVTVAEQLLRRRVGPGVRHLAAADRPRRPDRWAYEVYFEARAQAVLEGLRRQGVDALLTPGTVIYSYWLYVTARVGVLLAERAPTRLPVLSRAHGYDVNPAASPVGYLPARRSLLQSLDRVHPVADTTTARLRREHPEQAARISTRRLGSTAEGARSVARREPLHLVSVATVRPLKRLDLLVGAVALLQHAGTPVTWTHLGTGGRRQVEQLQALAERRLRPGSFALQGAIAHDAVLDWYRRERPSLFVSCSSSEGVPVSIMEALSMGVPVLATDVGGTSEVLAGQPMAGLLPADPTCAQVADAVAAVHAMSDPAYDAVVRANHETWHEHWDASRVFAAFATELADLAGPEADPPGRGGLAP